MLSVAACRAVPAGERGRRCTAAQQRPGRWRASGAALAAVLTKARSSPFVCLFVRAAVWFVCLSSLVVEFVCLRWSRSDVTFSTDGPAQVP